MSAWYGLSTTTWNDASSTETHALMVLTATPSSRARSERLSTWPERAASACRNVWNCTGSSTSRSVRTSRSSSVWM